MARYIDADKIRYHFNNMVRGIGREFSINYIVHIIDKQPTADVEEVIHGKWLPQIVTGVKAWDCSECKTTGSPHWKRCPICEAKMDGGKEE